MDRRNFIRLSAGGACLALASPIPTLITHCHAFCRNYSRGMETSFEAMLAGGECVGDAMESGGRVSPALVEKAESCFRETASAYKRALSFQPGDQDCLEELFWNEWAWGSFRAEIGKDPSPNIRRGRDYLDQLTDRWEVFMDSIELERTVDNYRRMLDGVSARG